jgi:hypothetical protein
VKASVFEVEGIDGEKMALGRAAVLGRLNCAKSLKLKGKNKQCKKHALMRMGQSPLETGFRGVSRFSNEVTSEAR